MGIYNIIKFSLLLFAYYCLHRCCCKGFECHLKSTCFEKIIIDIITIIGWLFKCITIAANCFGIIINCTILVQALKILPAFGFYCCFKMNNLCFL